MELRKLVAMSIGIGAIAAGSVIPAQAHGGPGVCVVAAQNANVSNVHYGTNGHPGQTKPSGRYGLYYPPTDPQAQTHVMPGSGAGPLGIPNTTGDRYTWVLNGSCANGTTGGGGNFTSSGTGIGYCGRSTGIGTGKIVGQGGVIHNYIIKWESAGSQLLVIDPATANGPNQIIGSVNAQPNPAQSADGSCVDGTAVKFLVDGALVH